jgi:putative peptidoglycan binding protein
MPRRRRRGSAAAAAEAERGLTMRLLLHSPKDTLACALAFTAVSAIVANALFLQAGRHPSPMFGSVLTMPAAGSPASPLPRPRPVVTDETVLEPKPGEPKSFEPRPFEPRPSEPKRAEPKPSEAKPLESRTAEPKAADPVANLAKATGTAPAAPSGVLRPPASIPVVSHNEAVASSGPRRVAAVQRALTQYGYGQLKPTGTAGSDTQAAIKKFERERKMPVTGHMSDRLVHELTAMIGHPID